MNSDAQLLRLSEQVGAALRARQRSLVTAESCTGGWIGKVLTDVPGSSEWYLGGAIVYGNALKETLLGVNPATLDRHGAVSEAVVREMALGALDRLGGDLSLAVTGIAGPTGGTADKPVGTVWFGWAVRTSGPASVHVQREVFSGDREAVRRATLMRALQEVLTLER